MPVHVVVCCQVQPDKQVADVVNVVQAEGVPEQVPPAPLTVQVQPSAWHCVWKFVPLLVQSAHTSGVPVHDPGPVIAVHPRHCDWPHSDDGHCEQSV